MACDVKTKAQLDREFRGGWTLSPMRGLDPRWMLQEGEPGHGGKAKSVTGRAVSAFLSDHSVKRVGGIYNWYYVRQDKV